MKTVYVAEYHHIDCWHGITDPAELAEMVSKPCSIENARAAFLKAGWEGDGTIGAIWLPPFLFEHADTYGEVVWHVKQSNDGTSWLCASQPFSFPGLDDPRQDWRAAEVDEQQQRHDEFPVYVEPPEIR